jgi:hypothetical protein
MHKLDETHYMGGVMREEYAGDYSVLIAAHEYIQVTAHGEDVDTLIANLLEAVESLKDMREVFAAVGLVKA